MSTKYPSFVIKTGTPALNAAVQHLCFAHGIDWCQMGGATIRKLEEAKNISNCQQRGENEGRLMWGSNNFDRFTNCRKFNAATDLTAFVEFLHNKPKEPTTLSITSQERDYPVKVHDEKTEVGCQTFQNKDILAIAEAIKARAAA